MLAVRDSYINILCKAINVGSAALPLRLPHLDSARNDNKDRSILWVITTAHKRGHPERSEGPRLRRLGHARWRR
jgi:hypothetical protein